MRHSIRRMPERPDVLLYIEALEPRLRGARLERVRLLSPFVLRSVDPPLAAAAGRAVSGLRRLGKRIVIGLDGDLFLLLHLMIAGRLHWRPAGARPPGKIGLAALDFSTGTLVLTEAGTKRRAAIHLVRGEEGVRAHDPGGLEVLGADLAAFRAALVAENHTLKRSLTDPRLFSGIGNAYSDEILHRARLSPVKLSRQRSEEHTSELQSRLHLVCRLLLEKKNMEYDSCCLRLAQTITDDRRRPPPDTSRPRRLPANSTYRGPLVPGRALTTPSPPRQAPPR